MSVYNNLQILGLLPNEIQSLTEVRMHLSVSKKEERSFFPLQASISEEPSSYTSVCFELWNLPLETVKRCEAFSFF